VRRIRRRTAYGEVCFMKLESTAPPARARAGGFTLIELTITLLVLAILAVVSLPSYAEYVRRGVRAEAQAFLIDVAAHQQQRLVGGGDYAATIGDLGLVPPKSLAGKYVVSISVPSAAPPTFTVSATPQGPQAAESCGTLALSSTGERMPAHCWP